jgi:hypothetical protein
VAEPGRKRAGDGPDPVRDSVEKWDGVYDSDRKLIMPWEGPIVKMNSRSAFLALWLVILGYPFLRGQQSTPQPAAQQPAQSSVPQQQAQPAPQAAPAPTPSSTPAGAPTAAPATLRLTEGTDVLLAFDDDLTSKTAAEGDPVTFVLTDDLKVGDVVVAKAGCKAFGEVSHAERAGMMGKPGDLSIRLDYLKVGDVKVRLRGTKGGEGQNGTTATVALTVLFGPIGLIKHGKDMKIQKGTTLKAYVGDDVSLPPAN